jgi:tetratricopeptide (TPR) repeat protein
MNSEAEKLQHIKHLLIKHNTGEAHTLIDELIRTQPNNFELFYWRGVCERFEGELDLAEKDFRSVIQQQPKHDRAFYGLADVLEHKGNLKEAISAYYRAASLGNKEAAKKIAQHSALVLNEVVDSSINLGVELNTERGIDYSRLRDFLVAGKWDAADEETEKLMLKAGGNNKSQWSTTFRCTDLKTIDNLWMYYSKGRFGFSVQQQIWRKRIEGGRKLNRILWERFGNSVGWFYKGLWLCRSEIGFDESSPKGHLPVGMWLPLKSQISLNPLEWWWISRAKQIKVKAKKRESGWHGAEFIGLLSRLETCKLPNIEEVQRQSSFTTIKPKPHPFRAIFVLAFGLAITFITSIFFV